MLADMGADVIKVEAPTGDENRKWGPFDADGESCNFMSVNRGKRGITLNLKCDEGREILYRLLESADVLLMSFLPQTAKPLGVDPLLLRERFPRLVIASISAFGSEGELADRPGYDSLCQAFSGIMAITGEREGLPVRSGVSFVDMSTGILAYGGVLTALEGRRVSGQGDVGAGVLAGDGHWHAGLPRRRMAADRHPPAARRLRCLASGAVPGASAAATSAKS